MLIIIVGPDGAGKSTLADKLSTEHKIPVIHRTKPETEEDRLKMLDSYKNIIKNGDSIILDRAWYCEMVYGEVMRDKAYISQEESCLLEKTATAVYGDEVLVVHCTDTIDNLWQRCQERGEDYITDKDTLLAIANKYREVLSKSCLRVEEYTIGSEMCFL